MSREEVVQLVSRALAVVFVVWALIDITILPQTMLALVHHTLDRSVLVPQGYLASYYLAGAISHVLRILILASSAIWLWKCGPSVQAVLAPVHKVQQESGQS